jgi:hypothetical protein
MEEKYEVGLLASDVSVMEAYFSEGSAFLR